MKKFLSKMLVLLMIFNVCTGINIRGVNTSYADGMGVPSLDLGFDLEPTVVKTLTDGFIVQYKANQSANLYYMIADSELATSFDSSVLYTNDEFDELFFGLTSTVSFSGLTPGHSYDMAFVLEKDGEFSDVVVLWGKELKKNRVLNTVFVKNTEGAHLYVNFEEGITTAVANEDLSIDFSGNFDGSILTVPLLDTDYTINPPSGSKTLDISIDESVFLEGTPVGTLFTYDDTYIGSVDFSVDDGSNFNPPVGGDANSATFELPVGAFTAESEPAMIAATYSAPQEGNDFITITMDRDITSAGIPIVDEVVQEVTFEYNDVPLVLEKDVDYSIVQSSNTEFIIFFKTPAKEKLKQLPIGLLRIINTRTSYNGKVPSITAIRYCNDSSMTNLGILGGPPYYQSILSQAPVPEETYVGTVPYALYESIDPYDSIFFTLEGDGSYVQMSMDGGVIITVYAMNGTSSQYMVDIHSDPMTLGGLAYNGIPVTPFDPFAESYSIMSASYFSTAPTLTVGTDMGVTPTITSIPEEGYPGSYIYTVTLNKIETQPVSYCVYFIYHGGIPNVNDDEDNPYPNDPNYPYGPSTDPTSPYYVPPTYNPFDPTMANQYPNYVPTPDQIVNQMNTLTNSFGNLNPTNMEELMTKFDTVFSDVTTPEQAYQTLSDMDNVFNKLYTSTTDPTTASKTAEMAQSLTFNTEAKLLMVDTGAKQLEILTQFVDSAKQLQTKVDAPIVGMNQSIGEMLQKTANTYGTTKITVSAPEVPVVIEKKVIENVIAQQLEGLKQLNALQQKFFTEGTQKDLKAEVKLDIQGPKDAKELKIGLPTDVVTLLQTQKIESISVKNQNVEIKLPVNELKAADNTQIIIEQKPAPVPRIAPPEPPKAVFEFSLMVNNEKKEKFVKPLTLTFALTSFGLENELADELSIYKFNPTTLIWQPVGGIVDPQTGQIFVTRDNLSQYTVLKAKKSFSDADNSWAKAEINAMLNKGIVSEQAKFEPQSLLTRGEFAQWIANAYGLKVSDKGVPFKDVPKDSEYYAAIAAVYQQGILQGSKDKFNPNKALTQNELAAALGKVLVSFNNKQSSDKVTSKHLSSLKTTQVASWAEDDMALLMELGLNATGSSGGTNITKEAAASAFMKFYRS